MPVSILNRALVLLVGYSLITTLFAGVLPHAGPVFVLTILALAGLKARIILSDYLELRSAPTFRRGFNAFVMGFLALAALIYALPFAM